MEYCGAMRLAVLLSISFALACSATKQELPKGPAPEYEDEPATATSAASATSSAAPPVIADAGTHD